MRSITVALALAALQGAAAFTAGGAAPRNLQARAVRMAAKKGGASKASKGKGKGMSKAEVDAYIAKVKAEVDAVAKARTVDTPAVVASASASAPAPAPAAPPVPAPAPVPAPPPSGDGYYAGPATPRAWGISDISPDGSLVQRIEGETRKTWKFNNFQRDRVHVALESEGRPITADVQLWLGPDWTPFSLKAYSEDGQKRPINTLVGTRNKEVMIEVQNKGKYEFPIKAASNYASDNMAKVPEEIPATTQGMIIAGNALHSWPIHEVAKQVEVVLHTDGRQLNAKIELLNGPNNPKQVYEVFTNNGDLNRLVVCIQTPEAGNTIRVVNLATVEFPCYANINQVAEQVVTDDQIRQAESPPSPPEGAATVGAVSAEEAFKESPPSTPPPPPPPSPPSKSSAPPAEVPLAAPIGSSQSASTDKPKLSKGAETLRRARAAAAKAEVGMERLARRGLGPSEGMGDY